MEKETLFVIILLAIFCLVTFNLSHSNTKCVQPLNRLTSGESLIPWKAYSYPTDPTADIPWACEFSGVNDIQCAFNYARTTENMQLGTSLPMLDLPLQEEWDSMSDGKKVLWFINQERIDRGVDPLHGIEANVTGVAQTYANYLLSHDTWGHHEDGSPWDRLDDNPAIFACHDDLDVYENLGVIASDQPILIPVERIVYTWMYADTGSGWGHRHIILWYHYNDNGGPTGMEGFLGIGRASGPYSGPFPELWPYAEIIVMNVFDPCSTWGYDTDGDGIPQDDDNCPETPNGPDGGTCTAGASYKIGRPCMSDGDCGDGGFCSMNQEDSNEDGIGDACYLCEADFNCDGNIDATDVTDFLTDFGRSTFFNPCTNSEPCNGDFNCDANVDAADVTKFLEDFGRSPFFNPCPACVEGDWCSYQ